MYVCVIHLYNLLYSFNLLTIEFLIILLSILYAMSILSITYARSKRTTTITGGWTFFANALEDPGEWIDAGRRTFRGGFGFTIIAIRGISGRRLRQNQSAAMRPPGPRARALFEAVHLSGIV